jgi:hypothetical protein
MYIKAVGQKDCATSKFPLLVSFERALCRAGFGFDTFVLCFERVSLSHIIFK